MLFKTYGDNTKKACIFIHGMLSTGDSCFPFAKYFYDDYYVIIPTLDSHYAGSKVIESEKDEAEQILNFLHEENIAEIALVHGTSMGAVIAFSFMMITDIPVEHYFFDGGPFFKFGRFYKNILKKPIIATIKKYKQMTKERLSEEGFVKSFIQNSEKSFDEVYDDYSVVFEYYLKNDVITNLMDISYSFAFPKIASERNVVFFYSCREPANKCVKKLRTCYPNSKYLIDKVQGHCGAQSDDPLRYSKLIKSTMN